jgi:large subunit ribosomal protein L25
MEIPEHIDLDVSGMAIGDTLRLADLAPVEGVTYLDDPEETVLASVGLPAREIEPEPEEPEEGEELAEGEEPPEGAEGAAEGEAADAGSGDQGQPETSDS